MLEHQVDVAAEESNGRVAEILGRKRETPAELRGILEALRKIYMISDDTVLPMPVVT